MCSTCRDLRRGNTFIPERGGYRANAIVEIQLPQAVVSGVDVGAPLNHFQLGVGVEHKRAEPTI